MTTMTKPETTEEVKTPSGGLPSLNTGALPTTKEPASTEPLSITAALSMRDGFDLSDEGMSTVKTGSTVSRAIEVIMAENGVTEEEAILIQADEENAFWASMAADNAVRQQEAARLAEEQRLAEEKAEAERKARAVEALKKRTSAEIQRKHWLRVSVVSSAIAVALFAVFLMLGGLA